MLINISFHLSCLLYFRIFSFHCSSGFLKFLRYIVAIYVLVSRALPDGGRALNPLHSISSVFFGFPFFEDHKALVGRSHWNDESGLEKEMGKRSPRSTWVRLCVEND